MLIAVGMLIVVPKRPAWYLDRTGTREGQTIRGAASGLLKVMARPQIWLISRHALYLPPLAANCPVRSGTRTTGRVQQSAVRLVYLGIAIGCPLVGWLNGRIGRACPILLLGGLVTSASLILLATTGSPPDHPTWNGSPERCC